MPNRYHGQSGARVLAGLTQHLNDTAAKLRANQGRVEIPADYRRQLRREAIADAQAAAREAEQAFVAWRDQLVREAKATLAADTVGSPAQETAKLRRELLTQRLIETARLQDERTGAQVLPGGRVVTNSAALALAAEAQRLYFETSDYHGAMAHADAALALGVAEAGPIREAAQRQIWEQDGDKRSAMRDLDLAERAGYVFTRDANAAISALYQAAASEAIDMGDDPSTYRKLAVGPSMAAKAAAIAVAEQEGKPYEAPSGSLASAPVLKDDPNRSAREMARSQS